MPLVRRLQRSQLEEDQPQTRLMRGSGAGAGPAQPALGMGAPAAPTAGNSQPHQPAGQRASLADYFRANMGQQSTQGMVNKQNPALNTAENLRGMGGVGIQSQGSAGGGMSGQLGQRAGPVQQYFGPSKHEDYGAAAKAAEGRAGLLSTQGGRQEALRQDYGQSSAGESNLDAALLGAAGGDRMQKAASRYKGLGDMFRSQGRAKHADVGRELAYGDAQVDNGPKKVGYENGELWAPEPDRPGGADQVLKDVSGGQSQGKDPNTLSDNELNAMGYMYSQAPGESYKHYSDRVAARKEVG
jgi:hypothetical protein